MYYCKPITSLTVRELKVLMDHKIIQSLLGFDISSLIGEEDNLLIDVLKRLKHYEDNQIERLNDIGVSYLDINSVSFESIKRIEGLSDAQVHLLINTRPYFSLDDLEHQGSDLQIIFQKIKPYIVHEGYIFTDKPQNKIVELKPAFTGLLVGYKNSSIKTFLEGKGLIIKLDKKEECWMVCYWKDNVSENSKYLSIRAIKEYIDTETIAPILIDSNRQLRINLPYHFDISFASEVSELDLKRVLQIYKLEIKKVYSSNYMSVKVKADQNDLSAIYRVMKMVVREKYVAFVEPTYLHIEQ